MNMTEVNKTLICRHCTHSLDQHAYGQECGTLVQGSELEDYCLECEVQGGDLYDDEEI
jgi:hypothetical protein